MCNFFRTTSIFYRNPYIKPNLALLRHILWQFRKITNKFPCEIKLKAFRVIVKNKAVANGAGSLLNAMGYYDPNNMYFLEELFAKKICNVFFDIGAYIGIYSLIAAHQLNVKVYSFEPHPATFNLLLENIGCNKFENKVTPFQFALPNYDGQTSFSDNPGSPINKIEDESIQVNTLRGDSFCKKQELIPDILKIDVEGHEDKVLVGFGNAIKSAKMIVVESRKINEIKDILTGQHDFLGPYKLDYRKRIFQADFNSSEDWIFIHPEFKSTLEKFNFSMA
jgi:FkbM family methyltransferase